MHIKTYNEIKNLSGYIGIHAKLENNRNGLPFVNSDILYSELARVSKPLFLNDDNIPCYQLIHLGGAFLSNEKYLTDVIVDENAWIIVTSQAANKVNETKEFDDPSTYNLNLEIKKNATLEFINDAIILYPKSRYIQNVFINIEKTGSLIYTDIISPGYSQSKTKYQYDEMLLNLEIKYDSKMVLYDKLYFAPSIDHPNQLAVMNNFQRCGTMILINECFHKDTANELTSLVNDFSWDFHYEIGVSEFSTNCIGIRILADQTYEIEKIFKLIHDHIRINYLNKKPLNLRKQP